jgi:hypothetical protein
MLNSSFQYLNGSYPTFFDGLHKHFPWPRSPAGQEIIPAWRPRKYYNQEALSPKNQSLRLFSKGTRRNCRLLMDFSFIEDRLFASRHTLLEETGENILLQPVGSELLDLNHFLRQRARIFAVP